MFDGGLSRAGLPNGGRAARIVGRTVIVLVPGDGIEPSFLDSKTSILPLDDPGLPRSIGAGRTDDYFAAFRGFSASSEGFTAAAARSIA